MKTLLPGLQPTLRISLLIILLAVLQCAWGLTAFAQQPKPYNSKARGISSELNNDKDDTNYREDEGDVPENGQEYENRNEKTSPEHAQVPAKKYAIIYVDPSLTWERISANSRIAEEAEYLERLGYHVSWEQDWTPERLARALSGGGISALSYFGHGGYEEKGVILPTLAGHDAAAWKRLVFQDLMREYANQGMSLDKAKKLATQGTQNLGLELVRNFSCHSLNNHSIAELFVKPGGSYWGSRTLFTTSRIPEYLAQCMPNGLCKCIKEFSSSELEEYQLAAAPGKTPDAPPPAASEHSDIADPVVKMAPRQQDELRKLSFGIRDKSSAPTGAANYGARLVLLRAAFRSFKPVDRNALFGAVSWARVEKIMAQVQQEDGPAANFRMMDNLLVRLQNTFH